MWRRQLLQVALALSLLPWSAMADTATRDPAKVPAGTYVLETQPSSLMIRIPLIGGVSRYRMRFNKLTGSFIYDPASWQATQVEIAVDPRSIDARDNMFNRAVIGYFEPDRFPVIQFRSTALAADASGRGKLTGDLTFHGVTRPVTLDVQFNGFEPGVAGLGARMGFSGTGQIKRSEFGMIAGRLFADDKIDLMFQVAFTRKAGP